MTDWVHNSVQIPDKDGVYLSRFGRRGWRDGEFDHPNGVAVSPDGQRIYVTDWDNNRIQIFDKDGKYLRRFCCHRVSDDGEFDRLNGVAVSPDGKRVYVVEEHNQRVQIFVSKGVLGEINFIILV